MNSSTCQFRQLPKTRTSHSHKQLMNALAEQSDRYRIVMEHAADAMLVVDAADGRLVDANGNAARLYGFERERLMGKTLWQLLDGRLASVRADEEALRKTLQAADAGFMPICECHQLDAAGRSFRTQLRLVRLSKGEPTLVLIYVTDILPTALNVRSQRIPKVRDALTGLVNRGLFINRLTRSIEVAKHRAYSLAVLSVEIDRFKYVKATLGDSYGDRVLHQIARVLSDCVRVSDAVARFSGSEFSIIVEDITEHVDTARLAEKIRQAVGARLIVDGQNMFLTASIGISTYPKDGQDAESLIEAADHALTRAKELGGNGQQFFSAGLVRRADEFFRLRSGLHDAIERREFVLHYQPKIAFGSAQVTGMEALIRWQHPERGLMLPEEFVHTAEASGLIVPIGTWVLETACRQLREWTTTRAAAKLPPLHVAVNLSARQLNQPHLDLTVATMLRRYEVDPALLELEVTESMVMDNPELVVQTLKSIRELGVRIALDDLGTGYSSLNHLRQLPIDVVKIDRSFVTDIAVSKCDRAIVEAIVQMAHALDMEVVAEGVESEEQYAELERCGCDAAQGFLASCPVPADHIDVVSPREYPELGSIEHFAGTRGVFIKSLRCGRSAQIERQTPR